MTEAANPVLAEVWRGQILESVHRGSAVVCRADGTIEAAWGDPSRIILPRSSCKMVQALPLVESGIADRRGLTDRHLALACASHQGAAVHTDLARAWLSDLGLAEAALRCGPQIPSDAEARHGLRESGVCADQTHNNCSGKHCGFLTLGQALGGGAEYHEVDHPVQEAVRQATAEVADEELGAFAIDGCSAPNYAMSLRGLATSMARFAVPGPDGRGRAMARLVGAIAAHPVLVAGERRACTALIRACAGRAVVKTGAEGVFVAILPEVGLGIALKCDDGSTRGSEAAITALLARYGALDRAHPSFAAHADAPLANRRGVIHGHLRAGPLLL